MSGNILFLGNKIFEIPPFFQTRPGDLGEKVHACSLRFSALKPYIGISENPLHIYVIFLSFFSNFTLSNRASKILIKKESSACKFHSSSEKTRTVVKEMLFRNTFSIFFLFARKLDSVKIWSRVCLCCFL